MRLTLLLVILAGSVLLACNQGPDVVEYPSVIPAELIEAIPEGMHLGTNGSADFNDDGLDDYYIAYGPAEGLRVVLRQLAISVNHDVTIFDANNTEFSFRTDDRTGDSIDDVTIASVSDPKVVRVFSWNGGRWSSYCDSSDPSLTSCE